MAPIASQITSLTIVYSTVYSDADQRKHQSSASLASVWGIHRDRWIPRTKASYAENVSIWWRHHVTKYSSLPAPEDVNVFLMKFSSLPVFWLTIFKTAIFDAASDKKDDLSVWPLETKLHRYPRPPSAATGIVVGHCVRPSVGLAVRLSVPNDGTALYKNFSYQPKIWWDDT